MAQSGHVGTSQTIHTDVPSLPRTAAPMNLLAEPVYSESTDRGDYTPQPSSPVDASDQYRSFLIDDSDSTEEQDDHTWDRDEEDDQEPEERTGRQLEYDPRLHQNRYRSQSPTSLAGPGQDLYMHPAQREHQAHHIYQQEVGKSFIWRSDHEMITTYANGDGLMKPWRVIPKHRENRGPTQPSPLSVEITDIETYEPTVERQPPMPSRWVHVQYSPPDGDADQEYSQPLDYSAEILAYNAKFKQRNANSTQKALQTNDQEYSQALDYSAELQAYNDKYSKGAHASPTQKIQQTDDTDLRRQIAAAAGLDESWSRPLTNWADEDEDYDYGLKKLTPPNAESQATDGVEVGAVDQYGIIEDVHIKEVRSHRQHDFASTGGPDWKELFGEDYEDDEAAVDLDASPAHEEICQDASPAEDASSVEVESSADLLKVVVKLPQTASSPSTQQGDAVHQSTETCEDALQSSSGTSSPFSRSTSIIGSDDGIRPESSRSSSEEAEEMQSAIQKDAESPQDVASPASNWHEPDFEEQMLAALGGDDLGQSQQNCTVEGAAINQYHPDLTLYKEEPEETQSSILYDQQPNTVLIIDSVNSAPEDDEPDFAAVHSHLAQRLSVEAQAFLELGAGIVDKPRAIGNAEDAYAVHVEHTAEPEPVENVAAAKPVEGIRKPEPIQDVVEPEPVEDVAESTSEEDVDESEAESDADVAEFTADDDAEPEPLAAVTELESVKIPADSEDGPETTVSDPQQREPASLVLEDLVEDTTSTPSTNTYVSKADDTKFLPISVKDFAYPDEDCTALQENAAVFHRCRLTREEKKRKDQLRELELHDLIVKVGPQKLKEAYRKLHSLECALENQKVLITNLQDECSAITERYEEASTKAKKSETAYKALRELPKWKAWLKEKPAYKKAYKSFSKDRLEPSDASQPQPVVPDVEQLLAGLTGRPEVQPACEEPSKKTFLQKITGSKSWQAISTPLPSPCFE